MGRQKVRLADIDTQADTQARAARSEETIAEYAQHAANGVELPPLELVGDGESLWCWDGLHRIEGYRRAGVEEAWANVADGTLADARWLACSANKAHGLKRSNDDKRKAAMMALRMRPELTNSAIAKHCGVTDKTVADARADLESTSEIPKSTQRVGLDGRTTNTANIGKRQPPPPSGESHHDPEAESAAPDADGYPTDAESEAVAAQWDDAGEDQPAEPEDDEAAEEGEPDDLPEAEPEDDAPPARHVQPGRTDLEGTPLPSTLRDVFGDTALDDLGSSIDAVLLGMKEVDRAFLRARGRSKALTYLRIADLYSAIGKATDELTAARETVEAGRPYAVCPECEGHGCKRDGCRGAGYVPAWRLAEMRRGGVA